MATASKQPRVELSITVEGDGAVAFAWRSEGAAAQGYQLLVIRTGARRAYTALKLSRDLDRYAFAGLSRHQRYLCALLATTAGGCVCSPWQSVTPRAGLAPRPEGEGLEALAGHLARVRRLTLMPQDRRLTAFWERSQGFVDAVCVEVLHRGRTLRRLTLEPEVASLSLDAERGVRLQNGERYEVRVAASFAGLAPAEGEAATATPAPQGGEREANRAHPQRSLVYPFLDLGPELCVFADEAGAEGASADAAILCHACRSRVSWSSYRLVCTGCGAEYIPSGRGDYLEANRLRFGTCRCCLPKRILIQRAGSETLVCSSSGKEHIRLPGEGEVRLIEDLPFGLCQCCRPRRPLVRRGEAVRCSKSDELHRKEGGAWVLAPSQPVFDARAIDELLDAGLAEIGAAGVSRGR